MMNERNESIELLKDMLKESTLKPQLKINKIVQNLQKTEDIMKAKILSDKILQGDFNNLKNRAIDNLIKAFTIEEDKPNENENEFKQIDNIDDEKILKDIEYKKIKDDNRKIEDENKRITDELQKEIKNLKLQMEIANADYTKKLRSMESDNNKLIKMLKLTKNSELIVAEDDDIDKLFIEYKKNGLQAYNSAFVSGDIIAKSYYKIK